MGDRRRCLCLPTEEEPTSTIKLIVYSSERALALVLTCGVAIQTIKQTVKQLQGVVMYREFY